MDYLNATREQLAKRIEELEMLNRELLRVQEQETKLEYAWTGNLGHWYWDVKANAVTFNPLKVAALGYDQSEIPNHVTYSFFTEKLHADDYQNTMDAMTEHLYGKSSVYEVEYRIQAKNGEYRWFYDLGKITARDEMGKPLFVAGIVFDVTEKKMLQLELEQKNKILTEMAVLDGLTRISNHRALIEHLNSGIANANRTGSPLCIAIFDIDDFKMVNDSKGHIFGDKVIADVAEIFSGSIRESDFVGRYGGEEFMIIFPDTLLATGEKIANQVREAVENHLFPEGVRVTISGGIKQHEAESVTELIDLADKYLYEAKKNGKNQIVSVDRVNSRKKARLRNNEG